MESLIDLKAISEVANRLIDKVSSAFNWLATHPTPKRIASETLIADIQKTNMDPVTKAILISQARKIIKEQQNQEAVLKVAIDNLKKTAAPDKLDSDWLAQFGDKTRLVSDETFQYIWGKILAQECNEPRSIPKSLLHILEQMDKEDAECFTRLCEYTVEALDAEGNVIGYYPIVIHGADEKEYRHDLSYEKLADLKALGLIIFSELGLKVYIDPIKAFKYEDEKYVLPDNIESVGIGKSGFTKSGLALYSAIDVEHHKGFLKDECIPFWISEKQ